MCQFAQVTSSYFLLCNTFLKKESELSSFNLPSHQTWYLCQSID